MFMLRLHESCNFTLKFSRYFTSNSNFFLNCLVDLTCHVRQNNVDPVVSRDREILRCIEILSRRNKSNVILLGDPGVGKSAIVYSLANRIISGNVPDTLSNYKIMSLDTAFLLKPNDKNISFDAKLKTIIQKAIENNYILFIDEAHLMLSKNYDWTSILKPELTKGDLKCIAATTFSEYRRYFIKDKAFQRRFQPLYIDEPCVSSTIDILKALKPCYESFHNVIISEESIEFAVKMSNKYIKDRFNPDKSIDLIDEASVLVKMRSEGMFGSASFEANGSEKLKLEAGEIEIDSVESEIEKTTLNKLGVEKYQELRSLIKSYYKAKFEESEALKSGNLENVGMLRFEKIPSIQAEITKFVELNSKYSDYFMVKPRDIANIISKWTRIPIFSLITSTIDLLNILKTRLIKLFARYSFEVDKLIASLHMSSMSENNISVVAVSGNNYIDKQEFISIIINTLSENHLVIDLSEYAEKHSISNIIGPPPGYVGHEFGGQLTELIKSSTSTCIVFNNISKCNLSVMDFIVNSIMKGYIKDSRGEIISLSNMCMIIDIDKASEMCIFRKIVNEVIEISGNASMCIIEKSIKEYVKRVETFMSVSVNVDKSALEYISSGDSHLRLDGLKKFISKSIVSVEGLKEFTITVCDGDYTISKG